MCFSWRWTLTQTFGTFFFFPEYQHVYQLRFGFYQRELINASQINVLYLQWHFTLLYWFQGKSCLEIIKINPGGSGFYEQPKNQSPIHENTQMCSIFFSCLWMKYLSRTIKTKASETWQVKLLGALSALSSDTGERKVQLWIKQIKTQWMTEHTEELAGQITAE